MESKFSMENTKCMPITTRLRPYQTLIIWKEAHALCLKIYQITSGFPSDERYSLTSQIRRAAYSIPMNIAEGSGKSSKNDKDRFLDYAWCSLEELHYQCLLARDLKYINDKAFDELESHIGRVGYLLMRLRRSIA